MKLEYNSIIKVTEQEVYIMKNKTIITISRQFGSGGREIGKKLAEYLNVPFYDKELIELAAKESGVDEGLFEDEEYRTSRGFYLLGAIGYTLGSPITSIAEMSLNDRLFLIQSETIENIASQGPCVIVGRCADYVLKDKADILSVFIHANMKDRKERAVHSYEVDERNIENSVEKIDKRRANYYNYYTDQKWGDADNYDIVLDSSKFGIEGCALILKTILEKKTI